MSDRKMINRIGPSTLPWMTPASTLYHLVVYFGVFTLCLLFIRYAAIHEVNQLGRCFLSLVSRISWFTISNALLKSKNIVLIDCLLSIALLQSSITCITASEVFFPGRNPNCWLSFQMLLVSSMIIIINKFIINYVHIWTIFNLIIEPFLFIT